MQIIPCRRSAFTLIEIMIVIAIIGLLGMIAIPSLVRAKQYRSANACITQLKAMDDATLELYKAGNQSNVVSRVLLPITASDMEAYVISKMGKWPVCPSGGIYTLGGKDNNPTCSYKSEDLKVVHALAN